MIPAHQPANWERPFLAVQNAMDWFVDRTARLPGVVQLALWPIVLAVSIFHMPFALTHVVISLIVDWVRPQEQPVLSRKELLEWTREVHATWARRHEGMRECNPAEVADDLALPILAALQDVIEVLGDDELDRERVIQTADRLIQLPIRTAPDAHSIGLCIRHNVREWVSEVERGA